MENYRKVLSEITDDSSLDPVIKEHEEDLKKKIIEALD
jgi:hypothetical protein